MCKHPAPPRRLRPLHRVDRLEQLDYLVKEAELLDQRPGRAFYVGLRHKRNYRIRIVASGYQVQPWQRGRPRHAPRVLQAADMHAAVAAGILHYSPICHRSGKARRGGHE